MKRSEFLKLTGAASLGSFILPSVSFSKNNWVYRMACSGINERILVMIQLDGGNDGLNTIVPIDQYSDYANLRPDIRIAETGGNTYINLDSGLSIQDQVGLHPIMTGVKTMYDNGDVAIVQGVGYPYQNRSHFKSNDLWHSGGDGTSINNNLEAGWMGRYLEQYYSENDNFPLGIEVGSKKVSLGFHTISGEHVSINLTDIDPSGYYSTVQEGINPELDPLPSPAPGILTEHGELIEYIQGIEKSAEKYSDGITNAFNAGTNSVTYPNTDLANQLKTVAKIISGGCKTKIYKVRIGGFDTHDAQVQGGSAHLGVHASLLDEVSGAVKAFFDDLKAQSLDEKVIGATYSEFGRKARQNANLGSDHGGPAPMFLFGTPVKGGVYGTNVDVSEAIQGNNYQLQTVQHDYRAVITSLLQDFMGAADSICDMTFYDNNSSAGFTSQKVASLIDTPYHVDPQCYLTDVAAIEADKVEYSVYPNPATDYVNIGFKSNFMGTITVADVFGAIHSQEEVNFGQLNITLDVRTLAPGNYIVQLQGNMESTVKLIIYR